MAERKRIGLREVRALGPNKRYGMVRCPASVPGGSGPPRWPMC